MTRVSNAGRGCLAMLLGFFGCGGLGFLALNGALHSDGILQALLFVIAGIFVLGVCVLTVGGFFFILGS